MISIIFMFIILSILGITFFFTFSIIYSFIKEEFIDKIKSKNSLNIKDSKFINNKAKTPNHIDLLKDIILQKIEEIYLKIPYDISNQTSVNINFLYKNSLELSELYFKAVNLKDKKEILKQLLTILNILHTEYLLYNSLEHELKVNKRYIDNFKTPFSKIKL